MKKIFKKNQIIITVLALMIAVAGYINYADGVKKKNAAANKTKEVVGTDVDKDLTQYFPVLRFYPRPGEAQYPADL